MEGVSRHGQGRTPRVAAGSTDGVVGLGAPAFWGSGGRSLPLFICMILGLLIPPQLA